MRNRADGIFYTSIRTVGVYSRTCRLFGEKGSGLRSSWGLFGFVPKGHITRPDHFALNLFHFPSSLPMSSVSLARILYRGIHIYILFLAHFPCDPYFPSSKGFTIPLADMPSQRCRCQR
jgi:hypothetical protein